MRLRVSKKFILSTLRFVGWLLITFIIMGAEFVFWFFIAFAESIFYLF